ncbi:MAG TPA: hypothetical protein VFE17_00830 [Candidatus Baltobacteraceae bacterium]|jgi:hypothetical protein|nr:hypothetical protein [Candidatus Baltobacteraceae bacterium]
MNKNARNPAPRIISSDLVSEPTAAQVQHVRIPYQPNTVLFAGWGIKL